MFIDTAKVMVRAGNGGNGAVSFHREKYIAAGGPDGGDGGKGGDVIIQVSDSLSTLMDFRYKTKYVAESGENGRGKRCTGKDGTPLLIRVPRGTLIRDAETGGLMKDLWDDEPYIVAKGGKGGWGNQHFATPTRQVPHFAKSGLPGQDREILLELKLLADVGLVGFPNAGKSTLLSVVSNARPKIANYPFTTLYPNLGVVYVDEGMSFVMADIPGILEGAAEGIGLGHDFLRHIDRCRLLVHMVDVSGSEGRDPVADFDAVNLELERYSPQLASRPQIVAANKCDLLDDPSAMAPLRDRAESLGFPFVSISAITHRGTDELIREVASALNRLPPVRIFEPDFVPVPPRAGTAEELTIQIADGTYIVEGPWLLRLMSNVNFDDYESRMYFDRMLRESGLFHRLEEMGIRDGDPVSMYTLEFEYRK